jgi:hypothetical protein
MAPLRLSFKPHASTRGVASHIRLVMIRALFIGSATISRLPLRIIGFGVRFRLL